MGILARAPIAAYFGLHVGKIVATGRPGADLPEFWLKRNAVRRYRDFRTLAGKVRAMGDDARIADGESGRAIGQADSEVNPAALSGANFTGRPLARSRLTLHRLEGDRLKRCVTGQS